MSINLYDAYCIFSANENEYGCKNIIIRSHFFVVDVYYVFIKNGINEREVCYSLLPHNIKLKFTSKCKSFSKFKNINLNQQLEQCGDMFLSFCYFVNSNSKKITLEIDHVMD